MKPLKRAVNELYYIKECERFTGKPEKLFGDCSELSGNCTGLSGDCSELSGNCSGLKGDCSELSGNLDLIATEMRKENNDISHYCE